MKLTNISNNINEWFDGSGPFADVVISSRIRLARNLAGCKFLSCCSNAEKSEILQKLKGVLMSLELIFNAANISLAAFAYYLQSITGTVFVVFNITVAAAEVAVGLAILVAVYRRRKTVMVDSLDELRY